MFTGFVAIFIFPTVKDWILAEFLQLEKKLTAISKNPFSGPLFLTILCAICHNFRKIYTKKILSTTKITGTREFDS